MGKNFDALGGAEQAAIKTYARAKYHRLGTLQPPTYILRNAQADPEAWQDRLRELIASDPKRIRYIMDRTPRGGGRADGAFTLIEMSIVLVIIGLIVGGVLVGQNLIAAAAVRAQISQIERFDTAVMTFEGKYDALPGDIPDPRASSFGFLARGLYEGEGDGNGVIESNHLNIAGANDGFHWGGESTVLWVDLSTAHLIDGGLNTATPAYYTASDISGAGVDLLLPHGKIGGGNYIYVWSQGGINYFALAAGITLGNPYWITSSPGLTVNQAYSIDKKIDDGLPQSGAVTARYLTGGYLAGVWADPTFNDAGPYTTATLGSATTCYDNGNVGGATQRYSLASAGTGTNCSLSFQFQ